MSMKNRSDHLTTFLALATALSAAGAHAGDGVIEISPTRAAAGGITAGDSPGLPVTIDEPGSFRLTASLSTTNPNENVIAIIVDDVAIDLGGFEISGPAACSAVPSGPCTNTGSGAGIVAISGFDPEGVSVSNGTIRGMGAHGVSLHRGLVRDVRAIGNGGVGVFVANGSVRDSSAIQNGDDGIIVNNGLVLRSVASRNLDAGILLNGVVASSTSALNGGVGILGVPAAAVVDNTSSKNVGAQLSSVAPGGDFGYVSNLLIGSTTVEGGTQMGGFAVGSPFGGGNTCNGSTTCP